MISMPEILKTTILITNKSVLNVNLKKKTVTASTFNIPERLAGDLFNKAPTSGELRKYLNRLLNRYRLICYSGSFPVFEGVKTKHQEKGQNMERRSFRPSNEDWAELKIIANRHGMTATLFFVILLELDLSGDLATAMDAVMDGVDPTLILQHPISLTQTLYKSKMKMKKSSRFGKSIFEFMQIRFQAS